MRNTVIHDIRRHKTIWKLFGRVGCKTGKQSSVSPHHLQLVLQFEQLHLKLPVTLQELPVYVTQVQVGSHKAGDRSNMSGYHICRTEHDVPLIRTITINQRQRYDLKQNE